MTSPTATGHESGYIPTLDGWRAVAICAVIVSHSQMTFAEIGLTDSRFLTAASYGRLGVDHFFAISGFLITARLLGRYDAGSHPHLWTFYARRMFRIMPLYYGYLATLAALGTVGVAATRVELAASACFVRNYLPPDAGAYTNHFWSLSVEEHFYLAWPPLLVLMGPRVARFVVPALALAVHLWRSLDARYHLFASLLPDSGLLYRTDTRIDAILWGCFAALLCSQYPRWRAPSWAAWTTLAALVIAIVGQAPAQPLIFALLFPLLVVSTVRCPGSALSRLLEMRPIRWLGRLSYSLYVWQTLFLQMSYWPDPRWLTTIKVPPINYAMILSCAVASHYLVERPMIRVGRSLTRRGGN